MAEEEIQKNEEKVEETKKLEIEEKAAVVEEVVEKPVEKVPEKDLKVPEVAKEVLSSEQRESLESWKPKTQLGKAVFEGKITNINEILDSGTRILEPEIVDKLVPGMKSELILIGGRTGKGGGIERIPIKTTAAMHKSGRRFTFNSFVVVGNEDGLVGIGKGSALESRNAILKATKKAKLNLIRVNRGCGSWECGCGETHSIPYKITGKSGSVRVTLLPAPKGLGLAIDDESKKILRLAGIKDMWAKTKGNTGTRINLITSIYNALKNLYVYERNKEE